MTTRIRAVDSLTTSRVLQALPLEVRNEIVYLRMLVRDASRLLNEDLDSHSWGDDVHDWNTDAAPFVKG
jgi:hypothetical protein